MSMFSPDTSKTKGTAWPAFKDGKVNVTVSLAASISPLKVLAMAVVAAAAALLLLSPGVDIRARILELEQRMARKMSWAMKHRGHIHTGQKKPEADGRKHLLVSPGSVSRLAEAMAPHTQLAEFDDHYLCGSTPVEEADVVKKTIAIAAVTWRAPLSLRNSMESWRDGGLLDIVDEKMLFINSPTQEDYDIARDHDFDVYTTHERNGNIMAGPSLAYLAGNTSADYILFMEKDFVLSAPRDVMMREMYTAVQHLARGVDVYRLRGNTDYPAEGMPDCCTPAEPPTCPYHTNWKSAGYFSDHMNWLLIWCDKNIMENSNGRLVRCTREPNAPDSYCFTSGESNWSNNPVMFSKKWFQEKMRDVAFMDWERNNLFEFNAMMAWLQWKPPAKVCVSWDGIFTHREIDQ